MANLIVLVLSLASIVLFFIILYYCVCHIIKLWTGCSREEADKKLHNFLNGRVQYSISEDAGFCNDVWENIRKIIGEKRYEELVRLSQTAIDTPLLFFGVWGMLPCIGISVYYKDDIEKDVIENILGNLTIRYLQSYGYSTLILKKWRTRYDLNMPYLEIRYARTEEEKRILGIELHNERRAVISQNSLVIDDMEDEDLND